MKVAVVQAAPVAFDLERSLAKVRDLASSAAAAGAEFVVFPEAFLSAYPKYAVFGSSVGWRTPAGRREFQRYYDSSVAVPGPACDALSELAARLRIYLVIGVIEREGGTLFCTALYFAADGTLMGKHRKVQPTAVERLVWGAGDGSTLAVHETAAGVRFGAAICWESLMPQLRLHMYSQGVQLYCAPTVDARPSWVPSMQHIGVEGRVFVLSACQFARRRDFPPDYQTSGDFQADDVLIGGGSVIVSPYGDILAGPNYDGECILTADIDVSALPQAKFDLDVTGHYARPDIFSLHVDERPKRAVVAARL